MSGRRPRSGVPGSGVPGPGASGAGILGAAALIAVITVVARVLGFGRVLVYSDSVGATCVGAAYATANQLPNVLFEVVAGGALAGAVVPLLAGPIARTAADGRAGEAARRQVDQIAGALLTWALCVLLPLSVLLALVAEPVVAALLRSQDCPGQLELAARMLVVFAPQVVLYGVGVVLVGVLQAHRRFTWPAFAPLLSSLVVIGAYRAYAVTGDGARQARGLAAGAEAWLAWGTTAGVAVMTVPLLLPVLRLGVRPRLGLRFPPGVAPRALALASAGVVALLAQQASVVAAVVLSNAAGPTGALNVFQYVQAVHLLPYAVLAVPLATAAFPRLSTRAATGDREGFASTASATTRGVLLVSLGGAAVLVATAAPVGAFFAELDNGSVQGMAPALVAMAPGLVGLALVAHVGRALYALERGRAAATATVTGWLVVVVAMVAGTLAARTPEHVVVWLAAATSVGMTVAGVLLLLALRRAAGAPAVRGVARTVGGAGAAAVVAGAAAWWLGSALTARWDGGLLGPAGAAVVAAGCAVLVMGAGVLVLDRSSVTAARALVRRSPAQESVPARSSPSPGEPGEVSAHAPTEKGRTP